MWSFALACLVVTAAPARPPPSSVAPAVALPRTRVEDHTAADGTPYRLYVSLPRGYEAGTARFPVVVVLDADYAFAIVRNVVEHLSDRGGLPELIVVGIAYPGGIEGDGWLRRYRVQRTRDYTPTRSARGYPDGVQDHSGGGGRFLAALQDELLPALDARYRTVPGDRTIVGHSYGGLFGAYAVMTAPALFSRAVLVSPSLWYDDRVLFRRAAARPPAPRRVFLAAGALEDKKADGDIAGDVVRFAAVLRGPADDGGQVTTVVLPDETHDSVFPAAVTRGLRVVFGRGP